MDAAKPSRTAWGVAFRRACHQLHDAPPLVLDDPIAVPILGAQTLPELQAAKKDLNNPGNLILRAWLVARSRYAEEKLAEAVAPTSGKPVTQYVLLGAGLDTFAHRNPHPNLRVFEVDHPATQAWKRQLVAAAQLPSQPSLTYVPVNFETEALSNRLAESGFNPDAPAFFSWLGVTMYLTREANLATLRAVAQLSSAGSELAFTYMESARLETPSPAFAEMQQQVTALGEPFLSGFDPNTIAADLAQCGFELVEDLSGADVLARYGRGNDPILFRPSSSHVALARVIAPE